MTRKLRVMCVCAGGNVRSHALAYLLKSRGHTAFAVGVDHFESDSLTDLSGVVDHVLTTEHGIHSIVLQRLPPKYHPKVTLIPIGADRWGPVIPQELLSLAATLLSVAVLPNELKK